MYSPIKINPINPINLRYLSIIGLLTLLGAGCNNSTFRGSGKSKSSKPVDTSVEQTLPTPSPEECVPRNEIKGLDVAFVIDNSGSNSTTDCSNPTSIGTDAEGYTLTKCAAETNREKSVVSAFNKMNSLIANKGTANLSIVSFPESTYSGAVTHTDEWVGVEKYNTASIQSAMNFSRYPQGFTPYGAGLNEASELFKGINSGERSKLVILVTDGEPTDNNPVAVKNSVKSSLLDQNVKIVTVMVTGQNSYQQRVTKHIEILRGLNYSEAVIDELMGTNGKTSLIDSISTSKIEVSDSSKLEQTLNDLIVKEVNCQ